ncbi:hypothetical protein A374_01789 [Fictibacillus macauensis ZFHKF-1]|uniref:Flagellar protein FliT n=1 Tax=Fictibacillus macauensis ZFHKF-1 TaxID=1196324 RepID=I8AM01_9BACL|nr:hypothetical protein [Fictibacillus macauensis]EIT86947.1 hypothetical protein A374_01789 [Fictibacillus macauensis ZFHKF-1]
MTVVDQLVQLTLQIEQHVLNDVPRDKEEWYVNQWEALLLAREELMMQLPLSLSVEEQKRGQEIVRANERIARLEQEQLARFQTKITTLHHQQQHATHYVPTGHTGSDGMFFDSKQ